MSNKIQYVVYSTKGYYRFFFNKQKAFTFAKSINAYAVYREEFERGKRGRCVMATSISLF
jgi:hypothetical protein